MLQRVLSVFWHSDTLTLPAPHIWQILHVPLLTCVPLGHWLHAVLLVLVHAVDVTSRFDAGHARHLAHAVTPASANKALPHVWHAVAAFLSWSAVPAAHFRQCVAPAGAYSPAPQATHLVEADVFGLVAASWS